MIPLGMKSLRKHSAEFKSFFFHLFLFIFFWKIGLSAVPPPAAVEISLNSLQVSESKFLSGNSSPVLNTHPTKSHPHVSIQSSGLDLRPLVLRNRTFFHSPIRGSVF